MVTLIRSARASAQMVLLLLLLSAYLIYPALTNPIEEIAHDAGLVHIYRSVLFSDAISEGDLMPRWVRQLHVGLGGPMFTFQPPLPYYALDLLFRAGIPHPIGWRLLVAGGLFMAAVGAYQLVHLLTGARIPSLVSAVAFLYAPYMTRALFDRGSLEMFTLFLYPWCLWALVALARSRSARHFLAATLFWAMCIGTHVLGSLMLAPIVTLLALILAWRYRTAGPFLALLAGGLLTSFIWLPIAAEYGNVRLDQMSLIPYIQPDQNPIPVEDVLAAPAVYDIARGNNGVGDRIGWGGLLFVILGLPAALLLWRRGQSEAAVICAGATALALALLWLLVEASQPAWELVAPFVGILQFRMRLLGPLALLNAMAAGLSLSVLHARWQRIVGPLLLAALILVALPSLFPSLQPRHGTFGSPVTLSEVAEGELRLGGTGLTSFGEMNPRWRQAPFDRALAERVALSPVANDPSAVQVRDAKIRNQQWRLDLAASEPTTLTLHLLYYPRWRAAVDGLAAPLTPQPESGLAQLDLPAGAHIVTLDYRRSWADWVGLGASGLTLALLGIGLFSARQRPAPQLKAPSQEMVRPVPHWLFGALTLALLLKIFYIDPHTTLFRCQSTNVTVCGVAETTSVEFIQGPALAGYTLPKRSMEAGDTLSLLLVWRGTEGSRESARPFVHLRSRQPGGPLNPETGGDIWAQAEHDTPGGLPVSQFQPEKLYHDPYRVTIPASVPPGDYLLEVGLYDSATGEQLDVMPESIRSPLQPTWCAVLLPSITIR